MNEEQKKRATELLAAGRALPTAEHWPALNAPLPSTSNRLAKTNHYREQNQMNLQQELAALRKRIDELEAQTKTEATDSWPKLGDVYFYVDCAGEIERNDWKDDLVDAGHFAIGNAYRTEEEAEREVERRKVLTQLRKLAKASWGGTKIDWPDAAQYKWQIRFVHGAADGGKFGAINWYAVQHQSAVAFATQEAAQSAIETIGADRLMLLLED